MTIEQDFIPFAVGGSANVISQATYAADTTLTQGGFTAGIATSAQLNKVWRQSSIMAAVIASFIVAETGQTAIDDGTTATLLMNFTNAVNAASKNKIILTDTGTANAYAAANPVPLTALPTATGFTQTVKIAHLNTGTSTYAPDGLATAPIYGLGGAVLQGGELPANGVATLVSFVDPLLNSGNLCWVLYECVGGAQQVAPAIASNHAVQLGQVGHGQCRLSVASTTSLKLSPFNGQNVIVNGVPLQIAAAGITVSNGGLSASTLYYAYLAGTTASPVLNLSTTGHVTGNNGVEVKSGDATQTLVGMIYTNASSQFVDATATRTCLNWFNRRARTATIISGSQFTFTNTGAAEVTTAMRVSFLTWSDEAVDVSAAGEMINNTSGGLVSGLAYIDGVQFGNSSAGTVGGASFGMPYSSQNGDVLTESLHTLQLYGFVSTGTGTLATGAINKVTIRG